VQRPDIHLLRDLVERLPLPVPFCHAHLGGHDADEVPVEIRLGGDALLGIVGPRSQDLSARRVASLCRPGASARNIVIISVVCSVIISGISSVVSNGIEEKNPMATRVDPQTGTSPAPVSPGLSPLDVRAHRTSIKGSISSVTEQLTEILGAQLVAYIGSVKETRAVREWIAGTRVPRGDAAQRLRLAYRVAKCIADSDGIDTAQAWFQGLNPLLGNVSPARLIRTGNLNTDGPRIIEAEKSFLAA
jgi:hypothetical protein